MTFRPGKWSRAHLHATTRGAIWLAATEPERSPFASAFECENWQRLLQVRPRSGRCDRGPVALRELGNMPTRYAQGDWGCERVED